jgi:hypothetical protein
MNPLRIDADDAAGSVVALTFWRHLRSGSLTKLCFFQLLPMLILLTLVYTLYTLLSSPVVSYYVMLVLLLICSSSCIMVYPDKLAKFLGAPAVILAVVFVSYHLSLCSARSFTLLSGVVGALACLGLNVLSVFAGNPVSLSVQVACFATALTTPIGAAILQVCTKDADAYLYGLLLSCTASLFNLLWNRTPNSVSIGVPGRDFHVNTNGAPRSSSGTATPAMVSPSLQYVTRRS